jgi:hypothetical protein
VKYLMRPVTVFVQCVIGFALFTVMSWGAMIIIDSLSEKSVDNLPDA